MSASRFPNTHTIVSTLVDTNGWVSHDTLFKALQEYWTDDGCCARIDEAVADGVLIEASMPRYRLGIKEGLPAASPQRTKLEQISWLKMMVDEFESEERECYCINSFFEFVDETHEMISSTIAPELRKWSDMFPDGRFIFYEGNEPEAFANELVEKFNFDPRKDSSWGETVPADECCEEFISYAFHCPVEILDEVYSDNYPMGS